jgi:hypothetical protein
LQGIAGYFQLCLVRLLTILLTRKVDSVKDLNTGNSEVLGEGQQAKA